MTSGRVVLTPSVRSRRGACRQAYHGPVRAKSARFVEVFCVPTWPKLGCISPHSSQIHKYLHSNALRKPASTMLARSPRPRVTFGQVLWRNFHHYWSDSQRVDSSKMHGFPAKEM